MEIIDHDHDGRVSKSELASLLKDTAGKKPDQPSGTVSIIISVENTSFNQHVTPIIVWYFTFTSLAVLPH